MGTLEELKKLAEELNRLCLQCGGLGYYQLFDNQGPGWSRRCERCKGTGYEPKDND